LLSPVVLQKRDSIQEEHFVRILDKAIFPDELTSDDSAEFLLAKHDSENAALSAIVVIPHFGAIVHDIREVEFPQKLL
jgi:hypothetical protein